MMIRDPFRESGFWFVVADRHFELRCTCGVTQRADALVTRVSDDVTLYDCTHCATTLVGIAADDRPPVVGANRSPAPDDDGLRLCGYVFGSAVDMTLWPPGAAESFLDVPARPGFFTARGCT